MATTPVHRQNFKPRPQGRTVGIAAAVIAVVALAAGGTVYATTSTGTSHAHTSSATGSARDKSGSAPTTTAPLPPLSVVSVSPVSAATGVAPNTPIQIQFSEPLNADTAKPTLTPDTAGVWTVSGSTMTFQPTGGFLPYSKVQLSVPTTTEGTVGKRVTALAAPFEATFTAAPGSIQRVEQILAELNYMPLSFSATSSTATTATTATPAAVTAPVPTTAATTSAASDPASTLAGEATAGNAVNVLPRAGTMAWRFPNTPSTLQALWSEGKANTIDKGAIMAFQNDHNMRMDGVAGPQVWSALVNALAARQSDARPYNYLVATVSLPETLTVYSNGKAVYTSPANAGVAGAATAKGSFPVYDRYASTTMSGQNPDGSTYHDPNIPWVAYFNGGDAVHGFPRDSYGTPQSVGCVELPIDNAKVVWGYDTFGTLVTVA